jgi:hypothetical protein
MPSVAEASEMRTGDLHHLLSVARRYFFVSAPSRIESTVAAARATAKLGQAVGRLEVELNRLDDTLRHPYHPPTAESTKS